MWTRVSQIPAREFATYSTPRLLSGEALPHAVFTSGVPIGCDKLFVPEIRSGAVAPIGLSLDSVPILNTAAAKFFRESLSGNVQLISARSETADSLWVCNILKMLDGIDQDRTKAEYNPDNYPLVHLRGKIKTAFRINLLKDRVGLFPVFRLSQNPIPLVATKHFLHELDRHHLFGLEPNPFPAYE